MSNLLDKLFPNTKKVWTLETAIKEAKKYKARRDFTIKNCGAYQWLLKNSYIKELDKVFPPKYKKWTLKKAVIAAKKCKTKSEFKEKFPGAFYFLTSMKQ
mgnify:CR=1 FL=1